MSEHDPGPSFIDCQWKFPVDYNRKHWNIELIIILTGMIVRIWFFFLNDSFWRDESKVLLNVVERSWLQLLSPLDYGQAAPIPWLWLNRLVLVFSGNELALRSISLLVSLVCLLLFYKAIRLFLSDTRGAILAISLMAFSPGIILFSAQAKHYIFDILISCYLLLASAPWFKKEPEYSKGTALILAGIAGPWFSFPAVFVAAGIGLGLLFLGGSRRIKQAVFFLAATSISFGLEFFLVFKPGQKVHKFMEHAFLNPTLEDAKVAFYKTFYAIIGPVLESQIILATTLISIFAGLVLLGIWSFSREKKLHLVFLFLVPLSLAYGCSLFGKYPLYGRTLLFATPFLFIIVGQGVSVLLNRLHKPFLAWLFIVILVAPCIYISGLTFTRPIAGVRSGLEFIASHQEAQDLVFCDVYAAPTIYYYLLMKREYALSLNYGWNVQEWIEGKATVHHLTTRIMEPLYHPERRIWLIAETQSYARGPRKAPNNELAVLDKPAIELATSRPCSDV